MERDERGDVTPEPGGAGVGAARMLVLMCAFALGTVGAFLAYFAPTLIAATLGGTGTPSGWLLVLCAAIPVTTGVCAVALSLWTRTPGKALAAGCGTLLLGALLATIVVFAVAA